MASTSTRTSTLSSVKISPNHHNNFNLLRLVAALLVIVSHSFTLLQKHDPLTRFNPSLNLGGLAVGIFFLISGFLIYKSRVKNDVFQYFKNRILRLYPGLLVCLAISFLFIYPFFTKYSFFEYFQTPDVWDGFGRSLFLLFEKFGFAIPGFFPNNYTPDDFNGSLWSLPLEFSMYCILALLIWKNSQKWLNLALILGVYILFQFGIPVYTLDPVYHPITWVNNLVEATVIFKTLHLNDVVYFGSYFMAGSLVAILLGNRKIPHFVGIPALALGLFLSVAYGMQYFQYQIPILAVGVFYIGLLNWPLASKHIAKFGDLSYGIYIYGYVIQQCLIALFLKYHRTPTTPILLVLTLLILLPTAYLSWHFIEKRTLLKK